MAAAGGARNESEGKLVSSAIKKPCFYSCCCRRRSPSGELGLIHNERSERASERTNERTNRTSENLASSRLPSVPHSLAVLNGAATAFPGGGLKNLPGIPTDLLLLLRPIRWHHLQGKHFEGPGTRIGF